MTLGGFDGAPDIHVMMNMHWDALDFELPVIPAAAGCEPSTPRSPLRSTSPTPAPRRRYPAQPTRFKAAHGPRHDAPNLANRMSVTTGPRKHAHPVRAGGRIIAVSNHTKSDLCRYLGVSPGEGVGGAPRDQPPVQWGAADPRRGLPALCGVRSGYKNFLFFVSAVARLLEQANLNLVCAGAEPFSRDEMQALRGLSLEHRVRHIPYTARATGEPLPFCRGLVLSVSARRPSECPSWRHSPATARSSPAQHPRCGDCRRGGGVFPAPSTGSRS